MNLPSAISAPTRWRARLTPRVTVTAVILLIGLAGYAAWWGWSAYSAKQLPGTAASAAAIEAAWGVQVKQIGVTADGGLIDLRFTIIDPDKAGPLFSVDKRPRLIVEDSGALVDRLMHPPHAVEFAPGQVHYLLYNNTNGAIKRGAAVSVVLGDLRLEHLIAK